MSQAIGLPTLGVLTSGAGASEAPEEAAPVTCAGFPRQRWMVRDPLLDGDDGIEASSSYGPRTGQVVPDSDNAGNMLCTAYGEPDDDTAPNVQLRLLRGGRSPVAEFAYKPDEEEWRGCNDDLYAWGHHCPLQTSHMEGAVPLHSRVFRRVLIIAANDSGGIGIYYVDAAERPVSFVDWNLATFTPINGVNSDGAALAGCELADGTLLLGVRREILDPGGTDVYDVGDWDLYRSLDGGLTWELLYENVLSSVGYGASPCSSKNGSRMAGSGDYVRWVLHVNSSELLTLVSTDRGTSWSALATISTVTTLTDQTYDACPFDLVGLDEAGTFALVADPSGPNDMKLWSASGTDGWTESSVVDDVDGISTLTPRGYAFLKTPYWLYLYVVSFDPDTDSTWNVLRVPCTQALSGTWELYIDPNNLRGATRLAPVLPRAVWCGDRGLMLHYLQDMWASPFPLEASRPIVHWIGGWSARPAATDWVPEDGVFEVAHWSYVQGQPAGGVTSATNTDWINSIANGGTHSWTIHAMPFETYTAGDSATQRITLPADLSEQFPFFDSDASSSKLSLIRDRFVAEWVMAIGMTGNATANNIGVRVRMPSKVYNTGDAWQLMIRTGPVQTVVYDETNSVPLATMVTITAEGDYRRYRFCVSPAATPSDPYGVLMWRREGTDEWNESEPFPLGQPMPVGITQLSVSFGHMGHTPASTMYSWWRELHVYGRRFRTNYAHPDGWDVDDLPGAIVAPRMRYLGSGNGDPDAHRLAFSFDGGGGAKGDSWSHALDYSNGPRLISLPSPRDAWASAVGATAGTALIFDACHGSDVDTGQRFQHNAVALYGLESRTVVVDYSNDPAFGTSVFVAATFAADVFSDVRIEEIDGNVVLLRQLDMAEHGIRPGELVGKFIQVTADTPNEAGESGFNTIHKIEQHYYDGGEYHRFVLATGGQFSANRLSSGATVRAFSDRAWVDYPQTTLHRYMRVRMGVSGTGSNNWDGRWKLANVIAGLAKDFDPPLDWSFSDEETPNVAEERGRGGQRWSYELGPASRTITARMIGDVEGERAIMRDTIRNVSRYGEQPIALLVNNLNQHDQDRSLFIVKFDGAFTMDNQAWGRDSMGIERPVGDVQLVFSEYV